MNRNYLGIDIGGTFIKLGLVDDVGPVIANAQDRVPGDFGNIYKTGRRYFSHDMDLAGSHYRFTGHPAFRVLFQNCVQDRVRNLIGNLIRMTFRNRFRGK